MVSFRTENPLGFGINALGGAPQPTSFNTAPLAPIAPTSGNRAAIQPGAPNITTPQQIQALLARGAITPQDAIIELQKIGISGGAALSIIASAAGPDPTDVGGDPFDFTPGTSPIDPSVGGAARIFTPQQENEQLLSGSPEGRFTLFNAFLNQNNPGLNPIFGNAITNRTFAPQSAAFQLDNVLRNFNAGQFVDSGGPAAAPENFSSFLGNNFGSGIPSFGGQLGQLAGAFGGENTIAQETALDRLRPGDTGTQSLAQSLISSIIGSRLAPSFRSALSNRLTPLFSAFQTQNPGQGIFEAFLGGNLGTGFGGFGGSGG